ncbi:related to epoxide hydrolase [Rhynchosporium agropyri]|uniref:Related to epoxide hydrolase n=1 Tax=Rhynchosporium agropyri TaxID=914238 RepID=A0A1E1LNV8_9HELO|nr:related to epoxide hydrolase [Rhynchosporium agropyri]
MAAASASLPPLALPPGVTSSYLPSHDLNYHYLSCGQSSKPLILLLHGFPEIAFSWRKIMPSLASEGYHVVAYDQRGYGRTTGWDTRDFSSVDLGAFTFTHLVRDALIFVNALGYKEVACMIGHDFGAVAASMCALMRGDVFKSVITMSHPFKGSPTLPFNTLSSHPVQTSEKEDIHKALAELPEPRKHYKWYYSTQLAASEMNNPKCSLHSFLRGYFHLKSADWSGNHPAPLQSWTAAELAKLPYYYLMPLSSGMRESVALLMADTSPSEVNRKCKKWLPDEDLAVYVQEWSRNGFQGGLNWYRTATDPENMKDVELFAGRTIDVPALFIGGKQDWGTYQEPGAIEKMDEVCTMSKGVELVDGAGHWIQQEQPERVVELVAKFLRDVKVDAISH